MHELWKAGKRLWSAAAFTGGEVSSYAEPLLLEETRRGIVTLSLVFLALLSASAVVHRELGLDRTYVYTSLALAALCAHVAFSARAVRELRALHVLGMALLIVSGTAFVLLAHRTSSLGAVLFTSAALLFMVVPLVPWGLREASLVTLLLYGVFSSSTWTVSDRFDSETLWALNSFMLAAGAVSLILVGYGTRSRKHDLETRFALERSRSEVERLSLEDPLTGAWNRRYLESAFTGFIEDARKAGLPAWFAAIDCNGFKKLNDTYGHGAGDDVLRWLSHALSLHLGDRGHVVRTGGDEFVVLIAAEAPEPFFEEALDTTHARAKAEGPPRMPDVSISVGAICLPDGEAIDLEDVYLAADGALYHAKASDTGVLRMAARSLPTTERAQS